MRSRNPPNGRGAADPGQLHLLDACLWRERCHASDRLAHHAELADESELRHRQRRKIGGVVGSFEQCVRTVDVAVGIYHSLTVDDAFARTAVVLAAGH
jgi:hypothetical protein